MNIKNDHITSSKQSVVMHKKESTQNADYHMPPVDWDPHVHQPKPEKHVRT